MSVISMKQLLEAGVHFGHQTRRWNPKMAPYIFTERNGIHIIDLQKSVGKVDEAYKAVFDIASQGGTILFVGTKKQAQDAVRVEAERCGMFYVNERWLGGMLTNFKTIRSRIERLKQIEVMSQDGTFDVLPKKEVIALRKEWDKLEKTSTAASISPLVSVRAFLQSIIPAPVISLNSFTIPAVIAIFVEAVATQAVESDAADLDAFLGESWKEDSSLNSFTIPAVIAISILHSCPPHLRHGQIYS